VATGRGLVAPIGTKTPEAPLLTGSGWHVATIVSGHRTGTSRDRGCRVRDVDNEARAETSAEARYRELIEHAPEAIVVLDAELGRFVTVNGEAERMFGLPREELLQLGPVELSPAVQPDGRPSADAVAEQVKLALDGHTPTFDWLHRRGDGTLFLSEVRLLRLPADRPLVRGSLIDITERRRADDARRSLEVERTRRALAEEARDHLAESEARLRAIIESSADSVYVKDAEGRYVLLNSAAARMLELPVEEVQGRFDRELFGDDFAARLRADDRAVMERATAKTIEKEVVVAGRSRVFHTTKSPLYDARGRVVGVVGVSRDVSERKREERSLRAEHDRQAAILGSLQDGLVVTDRRFRISEVNDRFCEITGATREEIVGSAPPYPWLGIDSEQQLEALAAASAQRAREFDATFERRDGTLVHVIIATAAVAASSGSRGGYIATVKDVTDRRRAVTRAETMQAITSRLASAVDSDEIVKIVVDGAREALDGIVRATVFLVDGDSLVLQEGHGFGDDRAHRWSRCPIDFPAPVAEAVRTHEPVLLSSLDEVKRRFPFAVHDISNAGESAVAAYPLLARGRVLGALTTGFRHGRSFDSEARAFLATLAQQCAQALERSQVYEAAEAARERAERAAVRLSRLQALSAALSASLTAQEAAQAAVDLGGAALEADGAAIALLDDGEWLEIVALADEGGEARRALDRFDWRRFRADGDSPPATAVATRRIVWYGSREELVRAHPDMLDGLAELSDHAWAIAPLIGSGGPLGALIARYAETRTFGDDDRTMLQAVAQQCSQALERTGLYDQERRIAQTLQQSLLPERLPLVRGMEVSALYRPAGPGNDIGGDFYDLFETDGGWVALIGDVCGKGPEAARLTALARYTVRTSGMEYAERSPARMLSLLNRAFLEQLDSAEFCTAICLRLEPVDDGRIAVRMARAGHCPLLVLRADGHTESYEPRGGLLGIVPDPQIEEASLWLDPGDVVVLYTDGVIEARRGVDLFGQERLESVVKLAPNRSAHVIAGAIDQAVEEYQAGPLPDDLALLVLEVTEQASTTTSQHPHAVPRLDLSVPAEAAGLSSLRSSVRAWLSANDVATEAIDEITLACHEAAANSVEHGYGGQGGEIVLRLRREADVVVIEIVDQGAWDPVEKQDRGMGIPLMRALMDDVVIERDAFGTTVTQRKRLAS
jgi:PAS domain S-box-containing protein